MSSSGLACPNAAGAMPRASPPRPLAPHPSLAAHSGRCRHLVAPDATQRSRPMVSRRRGPEAAGAATLDAPSAAAPATSSSTWPAQGGHTVHVRQSAGPEAHRVTVQLAGGAGLPRDARVELHWGVYRSESLHWQHPAAIVPPGSHLDAQSGGMRSPMQWNSSGTGHAITLAIPAELAPLTLAFVVHVSPPAGAEHLGPGRYLGPVSGPHFAELVGMAPGLAEPLGVSWAAGGAHINFAMRTRGAERVSLVVLKPPPVGGGGEWGVMEVALDPLTNRTGDTWHVALAASALRNLGRLVYGWRVDGDTAWETGNRFKPDQVLLDPHAPLLAYLPLEPAPPLPLPTVQLADGRRVVVLGSLACLDSAAQEAGLGVGPVAGTPALPGGAMPVERLRLFELDVRSFAQGKKVTHPGCYLGVAQRADHLKAVGANAVLLAPAYATGPGIGPLGRAAVSFMAPDPQLCSDPSNPLAPAAEFKAMVAQLHSLGVEVIMQVDFTFTAEGTDAGPNTLSFRGLDHAIYYRPNANGVLNCGHVVVRQYITEVLRHWATEYGVDGFCFLNADNLVQDRDGLVLDAPPLLDALAFDPLLSSLKLIASPSDETLLPRGGARGFPHWGLWLQRNTLFTRDMLAFLLEGTSGMASAIATRLTGSPDIFTAQWDSGMPGDLAAGRRPAFGVNAVATLGHTPLQELAEEAVAMVAKATGPAALRGGPGPTPAAAPVALGPTATAPPTTVLAKSLLMVALLAQGVPMVPQSVTADVELARFVGMLMRLRRRLQPLLLPPLFDSPRDIGWHGAVAGAEPDWDGSAAAEGTHGANYIAFSVFGPDGRAIYLGINPHGAPLSVALPAPPAGGAWARLVDTGLEAPEDAVLEAGPPLPPTGTYALAAKAAVLLVSNPGVAPAYSAGYSGYAA